MKKLLIIIILFKMTGCQNNEGLKNQNNVFGYEMEGKEKVEIIRGDKESLKIIEKYFEGYNNKDLGVIENLEHEDFIGYSHTGQIVNGSKEHILLSKQFLDTFENARWDIIWSISSNIQFKNKPVEHWVTTCLNISFGEGEKKQNYQRIFDAQIVKNRISKAFLYQRTVTDSEIIK